MADEQNLTPEEARSWVRHPIPPEILAEIRAEYDKPETIAEIEAEIEDVIAGRVRMYTVDEVLAGMWAAAGQQPPG